MARRIPRLLLMLALIAGLGGCTCEAPSSDPPSSEPPSSEPPSSEPPSSEPPPTPEATFPGKGPPPGDPSVHVRGPDDPHHKFLLRARSQDGVHWERIPGVLARRASSPQVVVLGGELQVYFVLEGNRIARLPFHAEPGATPRAVEIEGQPSGLVVDPHVVALPGGDWRLYYIFQPRAFDPGKIPVNHVYSARSPDGATWERESGQRWESAGVDPDVVALPGGGWRMYTTHKAVEVHSARSPDGLAFEAEPGHRLVGGGVTSTLRTGETWRMYYHVRHRIHLATSHDGLAFEPRGEPILSPDLEGEDRYGVESPSVARHRQTWWMVYASTRSEGAVPGGVPDPQGPGPQP